MCAANDGWTSFFPKLNLHDIFYCFLLRSIRDIAVQLMDRTQNSTVQQLVFVRAVSAIADILTRVLGQATDCKHPINSRLLNGRTNHSQLCRKHFCGHHHHDLLVFQN